MQTSYIYYKILTCISDCVLECRMQFSAHKLYMGIRKVSSNVSRPILIFDNTASRLFHISIDKIWILFIDSRRNLRSCHTSICKDVGFIQLTSVDNLLYAPLVVNQVGAVFKHFTTV